MSWSTSSSSQTTDDELAGDDEEVEDVTGEYLETEDPDPEVDGLLALGLWTNISPRANLWV